MAEGEVRGTVLNGFVKYVRSRWGESGIKELAEYCDFEIDRIKESEWYDSDVLKNIHNFLDGKGKDHVRLAGQFVPQNLGLLSYLTKYFNVKTLLKKAPKNYSEGFSYGSCTMELGDKEALIKFKDVMIDEHVCQSWRGVLEGALKATNTKGVVRPIEPPEKGEKDCFFKVEWE